MMRLELGINTCFAVKRWPRPSDWGPVVRERLGLSLVQVSLDLVDLDCGDDRIAEQAHLHLEAQRGLDLRVHSTFTGLAAYSSNLLLHPEAAERHRARLWFERAITFTAAIEGGGTGGHVGAFSVSDWHDPHRRGMLWSELRADLLTLAAHAHRAGQRFFLVENLAAAREPATMGQVRDLLTGPDADHAAVGLCLDVGHQCAPGMSGDDLDPYAWLRAMGRYAPCVQLQQSDVAGDHHWPFTASRNREGRIDADRLIDALEEGGVVETALVLEVIPPFEQEDGSVLDDVAESVEYWRTALLRRGCLAT